MDWFEIAFNHHEESNYSQALFAITKYVHENPERKEGKLLQAEIYRDLRRCDLALSILNQILMEDEDDEMLKGFYCCEMAHTYMEIGNYDEAVRWYDKYILLYPKETKGYIFKGACFAQAGKYELAKAEHEKATKYEGDPEEAFYNLALIYRAQMNFSEAKKYCEKSLQIDSNDKSVKHCLADIEEAIKLMNQYAS